MDSLTSAWNRQLERPHGRLVLTVSGLLLARYVIPYVGFTTYTSYKRFMALGKGGVPHNVLGWAIVSLVFAPIAISKDKVTLTDSFKGESTLLLPARNGPRPTTDGIAPHRQMTQTSPEDMMPQLEALIKKAATGPKTEFGVSKIEKSGPAVFVGSKEVAHVHAMDRSLHASLPDADAKEVIEKGWGERHRLAGRFGLSTGLVMVYSPRDKEELATVDKIVTKAVESMLISL